jgi:tRNA-specific 2-thiouridylase
MTRVVVALSGGVDSSVAAALLKQQGFEVIGMMMRLWSEPGSETVNRCCTPDALAMARRVAASLEIPFYAIDAQQVFRDVVVRYFLDGYAQGITPNPCLACNRTIRWEFLLQRALTLGADYMATGHYARVREVNRKIQLIRGIDSQKDQSYVLSVLNQKQLIHAKFPIGEYTKPQVRQLARDIKLPVAERAESQDLCFLGNEDYRVFLQRYVPEVGKPGPIITRAGQQLGEHRGLAFYTIGQRKGLGIASAVPMYVLAKDISRNTLVVGKVDELGGQNLTVRNVNWISGDQPEHPFRALIKIRYKATDAWGVITPQASDYTVIHFDQPLRDITPGQAVVFYDGETCLGGGIIET